MLQSAGESDDYDHVNWLAHFASFLYFQDVILRQRLLEVEESICGALSLEQAADRKAGLEGALTQMER